jgi:hypothetical protein
MTKMPKNRHALVLQQNRERRDAEVRRHSHTYLLDMVTLALGRMGWGEKRLREFDAKLTEVSQEFAELILDDVKDDKEIAYTKAVLDRELQRYTGTMFVPYDERYRG